MHSAIFEGWVKHRRRTPVPHAFRYRLFMMYLDLAELDEVFRGRWFWSTRRRALARFRRENHFGDAGATLDSSVRDCVQRTTGARPDGPIRLLTQLNYLGYCFNPVSFFYCYDSGGRTVRSIVCEVNNTPWGERHLYVLSAHDNPGTGSFRSFSAAKAMHVSPFMPMDIDYRWRLNEPAQRLSVHMQNERHGETIFDVTLSLTRTEITGRSLARVLGVYPLMTLRIFAAIHWQALKLWLKGVPVHAHPNKKTRVLEDRP